MSVRKIKPTILITLISMIVGIMLAIQYQTSSRAPIVTGSQDNIALRIDLQKERERKEGLLSDIEKSQHLLNQYKFSVETNSVSIMNEELTKVKKLAGLTPIQGKGFIIHIDRIPQGESALSEEDVLQFSDEDLRVLVNTLFNNEADAISINGHRLVSTSTIRNVANGIQVNTHFISLPLDVRVLGKDPDTIISGIQLAGMEDYFKISNLELKYEKYNDLKIPAYTESFEPQYIQPVKEGKAK